MDQRIILAVAGAGKTYYICNEIDPNKFNFIITYTNGNIKNIEVELYKKFGNIPSKTKIMTFHNFVYSYLIAPYKNKIQVEIGIDFELKGQIYSEEQYGNYPNSFSEYFQEDKIRGKYMSRFLLQHSKSIEFIIKSLSKIVDNIFVDEIQDFNEFDYDLINKIAKSEISFLGVGDFYQHSVTDSSGRIPFKDTAKDKYIYSLEQLGYIVDSNILSKSRRSQKNICKFINENLGIFIDSIHEENQLYQVENIVCEEDVKIILNDDSCKKIVYKEAAKYNFNAVNWGYSKGDTYDKTCVILTGGGISKNLAPSTRNKLYVALTRSKTTVYLVEKKLFDKVKHNFMNHL